jgi:hypothetical protein
MDPGVGMLYFPVERPSSEACAQASALYESSNVTGVLLTGFAEPRHTTPFRSVEDFAAAYQAGTHTPTAVITRLLDILADRSHPVTHAPPFLFCCGCCTYYITNVEPTREQVTALGAFSQLDREAALAAAAASTRRWQAKTPLSVFDGVPVAVKDSIGVVGLWTGYGRHPSAKGQHGPETAEHDDPIVMRFRAAGVILLGVTVMTEFGFSLSWCLLFLLQKAQQS